MIEPTTSATPLTSLTPAPWNPRTIRDERFKNLCASIQADPEFLWRRPILAMVDGTIYAGNLRYRAAAHLGMATVPAIVEDVPERLAKERALRDNAQWGDWHEDEMARLLEGLGADGSDLALLGISEAELDWMLGGGGPSPAPGEASSEKHDIGNRFLLRVLLSPVGVGLLEQAISTTGLTNRAQAMQQVLEEYLASKGQHDVSAEGGIEETLAALAGTRPGRSGNARRRGVAV